jgi:hypothetical protein
LAVGGSVAVDVRDRHGWESGLKNEKVVPAPDAKTIAEFIADVNWI